MIISGFYAIYSVFTVGINYSNVWKRGIWRVEWPHYKTGICDTKGINGSSFSSVYKLNFDPVFDPVIQLLMYERHWDPFYYAALKKKSKYFCYKL